MKRKKMMNNVIPLPCTGFIERHQG